jgi:hypothetical protein
MMGSMGKIWAKIASSMHGRSDYQCKTRCNNPLKKRIEQERLRELNTSNGLSAPPLPVPLFAPPAQAPISGMPDVDPYSLGDFDPFAP